jgi:hypothetical protein
MLGEQFQHVIEKADASGNFVTAFAFQCQASANLRLFGIAFDG